MNENTEINIKLNDSEYKRLKMLALDITPEEYLHKFIKKHLFSGLENFNANNEKDNHIVTEEPDQKFENLLNLLNLYEIKQNDIANYFKIGQSSVSLFFKKQNKKSLLYPKFFKHENIESIIYKIYVDKYISLYEVDFYKNEEEKIEKFIELHDLTELKTIIKILAARAKENFNGPFNIDIFLSKLSRLSAVLDEIEIEKIQNKDIEYLDAKLTYILEYL